MKSFVFPILAPLLLCAIPPVTSQSSNLPSVPPGIFTVSTRIEIKTTTSLTWQALTNFPSYPDWNPFVRSAIVITPDNLTVPAQQPLENHLILFSVQTPPLPLPVTSSTPANPLHAQFALENITHMQPNLGRLAWKYVSPSTLLDSERWQAISGLGDGVVLYESREVFSGAVAGTVRDLYGKGLQEGFEAQARGLKILLEGEGEGRV
ncbi:uncharacterized protein BDR25DRAFT_210741 [Lindgomyces ingoldianus]|uniref:Uncharacterized protein n=1 Tax=Lindgomyces ingoldianus TaxID=673940 RepID=A0ACB6RBK5_9PLEO|nr:uncharacterized protein BDR25DRAFT_210741 [Lindgomyces ingoldianus]KAF2476566.1 hypothetical protein BDR25DRAFT_210741 [Lindgomyces ingoldianus]